MISFFPRLKSLAVLPFGCLVLLASPTQAENETCVSAVAQCRQDLFENQDLAAANESCRTDRVPSRYWDDGCVRIFRSLTRLLYVLFSDMDGATSEVFTDSFKEMLDQFGFGPEDRDFYSFGPSVPRDSTGMLRLPSQSPDGSDVQDALEGLLLPALEQSIADLAIVPQSTILVLTASEVETIVGFNVQPVEIDYGDAKIFQALLLLWQSQLKLLLTRNADLEFDWYTPIYGRIRIQADIHDENPDLARLRPSRETTLAGASKANRELLDAYLAASAFIRSETDDQTDDLLTIEPEQLADETDFRAQVSALRSSLDGPTAILNVGTAHLDEQVGIDFLNRHLGTEMTERGAMLDLSRFYDDEPFDLRDLLPPFDDRNAVAKASFPDPTFRGVLTPVPEPATPALGAVALMALASLARRQERRKADRSSRVV